MVDGLAAVMAAIDRAFAQASRARSARLGAARLSDHDLLEIGGEICASVPAMPDGRCFVAENRWPGRITFTWTAVLGGEDGKARWQRWTEQALIDLAAWTGSET